MPAATKSNQKVLGEVARPVLAWPLRSWPRLAGVIAVVVVLLLLASKCGGGGKAAPAPTSTSSSSSSSPSPSSSSSSSSEPWASTAPTVDVPKEASDAAKKFMTAWLDKKKKPDKWRAGIAPYSSDELKKGFANTDPRNVPAERLVGGITSDLDQGNTSASKLSVLAPTDGGEMRLAMEKIKGKWLVTSVEPVDTFTPQSDT